MKTFLSSTHTPKTGGASPGFSRARAAQHAQLNRDLPWMPLARKPNFGHAASAVLQRKCACGGSGGECEECRQNREATLQRFASGPEPDAAPPIVHDVLRAPGQPLDVAARAFMEPRFGYDFSRVRVHVDSRAAESASAVNAQAYTVGRNIVFGRDQYAPHSTYGRKLIAHELTHVVQQGTEASAATGNLAINDSGEAAAELASAQVMSGQTISHVAANQSAGIQRSLLVTGKPRDIKTFLNLLEPASGLTLEHDSKTSKVTIRAAVANPRSKALALRLQEIINDPEQDAELNLGGHRPGLSFGQFPMGDGFVQQIDVVALAQLEAKAPGSGVAFAIHEIVENYRAHNLELRHQFHREVAEEFSKNAPDDKKHQAFREKLFEATHDEALKVEAAVAGELVAPGSRIARTTVDKGKGIVRSVHDYENYFLVYDRKDEDLVNAWQSPRVNVGTFKISGFAANSTDPPTSAQATVAAVADALRRHPAATVKIQCGGNDATQAQVRAWKIMHAILEDGKTRKLTGFDHRSELNFNARAGGSSSEATITVDEPDTEVAEARGAAVKDFLEQQKKDVERQKKEKLIAEGKLTWDPAKRPGKQCDNIRFQRGEAPPIEIFECVGPKIYADLVAEARGMRMEKSFDTILNYANTAQALYLYPLHEQVHRAMRFQNAVLLEVLARVARDNITLVTTMNHYEDAGYGDMLRDLHARLLGADLEKAMRLLHGGTPISGCVPGEDKMLLEAKSLAISMARIAAALINADLQAGSISPKVRAAFNKHFNPGGATGWVNFRTLRRIRNVLLSAWGEMFQPVVFKCVGLPKHWYSNEGYEDCKKFAAFTYNERRSVVFICPSFWHEDEYWKGKAILHEFVHHFHKNDDPKKEWITDRGYKGEEVYSKLTPQTKSSGTDSLSNADSYANFALELY